MESSEFEFLLSQYLDGTLDTVQAAGVEERLANDAEARKLLEQYRKLDGALQALPLPGIHWENLANQISRSLDAPELEPQSYPMPWVRHSFRLHTVTRWAVAAVMLVAVGLGVRTYLVRSGASRGGPSFAQIAGPQAETAAGTSVCAIEVGPSATAANVFETPDASTVVIASGAASDQDAFHQLLSN
jgi:negative regulator of sigma E activity